MNSVDESELLRLRDPGDPPDEPAGDSSPISCAVQTKTVTTYPTAANSFFGCDRLHILGSPIEGGPAIYYNAGETLYVYNLGASIPANGTTTRADFVANRWVMTYD